MKADGAATHKAPPRAPLGLVICNGTLIISYFCVLFFCADSVCWLRRLLTGECRLPIYTYIMHIFLPFCDIVENFFLFRSAGIGCIGLGINNVWANGSTSIYASSWIVFHPHYVSFSSHLIGPLLCIRLT